ncbi:MAG TPA: right-handed parallel beta-helix repeat-containing protein [Thermoanaerobaculia bacterium]|nr:right-handed parallel beta-helix repeat-containing protein [Thermoanaerobaculia bacterium]
MLRRLPVLLAISLLAPAAGASVIYVNAAAAGPTHDGAGWATAFADLQAALSAAGAADEIWVAAGTYAPTAGTDRGVSFTLKNGVGVYGGFAGTETLRSQRDPAAHTTTLSGEIGAAGTADNSYHVVTADGTVTASAVLDGFTITAGHANGTTTDQQRGGGMLVSGGSPTLARLRFSSNFASDRGGGVRVESGSPTFSVCAFASNSSGTAGGGLSSASATSLSVQRCAFTGNGTASTRGGGIDANSVAASDCLVAGNTGNGVYIAQDGATFVNCTIAGNSSYGAVFVGGPNSSVANSILSGDALGEISPFFFDANVTFSDVAGGHAGTGNIGSSPNFLNAAGGDYHLGSSSCVDAGSNTAAAGLTTDLDGLPRFFDDPLQVDTGTGTAPIVDMGAYERVPLSVSSPAGQSVCAGTSVSLSVTASGQATLSYRWRKGGSNLADGGAISGSGTDTLTIDPAATGDSGSYDVVVTDGFGQMKTSTAAALAVNAVLSAPVLTAPKSVIVGATGAAASVPNHAGSTYAWTLSGGTITSGQGTHQIAFSAGAPGTTMSLTVVETATGGCPSPESAAKSQVDFTDVPPSYLFHNAVVTVARDGITTGCGGGKYCPDDPVTRDAMAVFILRGEHGAAYNPPPAAGNVFSDVTAGTFLAKWMEQFGNEGISTGCGAGSPPPYCPTAAVTRDGMAVFLLRGKHGASFNPSAATGAVFCDVTAGTFLAKWMEELKAEGITAGCGAGACGKPNYCPGNTVTRGEMAAFIVKTFGLP